MRCPNQAKLKGWRHARGAREKGHVIFLKIGETHEEQVSRVPHSAIVFFALSGNSWVPLHPHVTPSREREIKRRTASSNVFKHVLSRATWFVQNPQAPIFSTQTTPLDTKLNSPVTFLKKKLKEKQMYGFSNRNATWQRLYFKDFIRH